MKWYNNIHRGSSLYCYKMDESSLGTSGGGGDSGSTGGSTTHVGFQLDDTPAGSPTGDTGGAGGQSDAGAGQQGGEQKPRLYTSDEVSKMIQGRLADDKHRKLVDRMVKATGLSADQIEQRLESYAQQMEAQRQQEEAQRAGVDPALYGALQRTQKEVSDLKRLSEVNSMLSNPKQYPGFVEIQDDVVKKADQYGIPLSEAYWIVAGSTRFEQAVREAEHRMSNDRQKMSGKDRVQGDASSSYGMEDTGRIPDDVVAMAKALGEDPEEYYDSMMSKDIEEWRERRAKRAAKKK